MAKISPCRYSLFVAACLSRAKYSAAEIRWCGSEAMGNTLHLAVLVDEGHRPLDVGVEALVHRAGEGRVLELPALLGGEPPGHGDGHRDAADAARVGRHVLRGAEGEAG